jgi:hypothetical protein
LTPLQALALTIAFFVRHPAPPPKRAVQPPYVLIESAAVVSENAVASIVIFDACQTCGGTGYWWCPWWGPLCKFESCPKCHGCKTAPVPPNDPPLSDEWGFDA